mgnify:CR=1 FL=1
MATDCGRHPGVTTAQQQFAGGAPAQGSSRRQQRNARFTPEEALANKSDKGDVSSLKFVFHGIKRDLATPILPAPACRDAPANREFLNDAVLCRHWESNSEIDSMDWENLESDRLMRWSLRRQQRTGSLESARRLHEAISGCPCKAFAHLTTKAGAASAVNERKRAGTLRNSSQEAFCSIP